MLVICRQIEKRGIEKEREEESKRGKEIEKRVRGIYIEIEKE